MKIKVLETIRQGLVGGGETHLISLVQQLDKNIFEPSVLSFTDGPMVERAKALGLQTKVIPTLRPFDITIWNKVRHLMADWNIDIVHAHGSRAASNVIWAAKKNHLPLIYTVHGWSFHGDQNSMVRKIRILGEQYITSRTQINISVSESNKQTGKDLIKKFDSVVIPNGIDKSRYNPSNQYADVRRELGIPRDTVLVLFIARFTNHKQPIKVIEGFKLALEKIDNLRLLMVGEGDARPEAEALVEKLGIGEKVFFQPFRSDVPDLLAAADIYALPSLWEGMSISLLEAMSMGKAIVASAVDGNKEVLRHMDNGWLVPLEKIEDHLGNAFITLSMDSALRDRLRGSAISTIDKEFSVEVMTRRTEEIYNKMIHQRA